MHSTGSHSQDILFKLLVIWFAESPKHFWMVDVPGRIVTQRGIESSMAAAMHALEMACEEEQRNGREAIVALEPCKAALFTHPQLQQEGQHIEGIILLAQSLQ